MNELKIGAFINYVSIIVRLGTSFLITPFIISSLGINEYGIFMLSNMILSWLALTDLGLGATVNKYVATYHARKESNKESHFLGQTIILFSVLGCLTFMLGMGAYAYLEIIFPEITAEQMGILKTLYLLTLGNLVLSFPLKPISSVPGAHLKFIVPGLVNLSLSLLNALLTVLLLNYGFKSIALTVLQVTIGVFGLIWGLYYTVKRMGVKIIFHKMDLVLYREMFSFSFWMMLNQLMDLFYWRAGAPILGRFSTMEAVAVYTLGTSLAGYFMTASSALSNVIAPKLMHMVALQATKEDLTNVMIRVGRLQSFVLAIIVSCFIILGDSFLQLWVGESMGNQVNLVWMGACLVILPLLIPLTQNAGLAILQALNIHKGRAIILFYTSLTCVVVGAILSYFYGALGMFIGTSVSLILGQVILINIYYSRKAGLQIFRFIKETYFLLLFPFSIVILSGILLQKFYVTTTWDMFFLTLFCYMLFSCLVFYILYLNREERDLMIASLSSIIKVVRIK